MLSRPHTPTPRVPISSIRRLLPFGLLANVLLPHAGFGYDIEGINAVAEDVPPVYPAWLEPWYSIICPGVWDLLKPDDELDEAVLFTLAAYEEERKKAGAEQDELDDIVRQARELAMRRLGRWVQLYVEPGLAEDKIVQLHAAQVEDAPPPPPAVPKYSVWPLARGHGRSIAPVVPTLAYCACAINLWRLADPSPFCLPDVPSPDSDRFIHERSGVRRGEPMVKHVGAAKKGEE
ncbi:hypothetical protein JCM10213_002925 [Rhodosporidiobolus nylandii]